MSRRRSAWGAAVLTGSVLLSLACAGGGQAAPSRDADLIERIELEGDGIASLSVYDAIQRLRPAWLRPRGATSVSNSGGPLPAVLVNDSPRRDIEILRSIGVADVAELRYIDARDATTRFGTGYVNGMIEVRSRTGSR